MNIIDKQSKFQRITIANDPIYRGEHILYLDTTWQYASAFEYRYHESIATIPACACAGLDRVLIAGGGDGLAAREILRFGNVEIDLVEIDGEMINLFSEDKMLVGQNCKSLLDEKCKVHIKNAIDFAKESKEEYDLVILDFPSPSGANAAKKYDDLFSPDIINLFVSRLKPNGILSAQTSVHTEYLARYARNMLEFGYYLWNYDVYYDRRGAHDSFMISSKTNLSQQRDIPAACRYATERHIKTAFGKATEVGPEELEYYELFEHIEAIEYESR